MEEAREQGLQGVHGVQGVQGVQGLHMSRSGSSVSAGTRETSFISRLRGSSTTSSPEEEEGDSIGFVVLLLSQAKFPLWINA